MKITNDKWLTTNAKKEEGRVFTLSRALQNAITMSAEYSGRKIKFTEYRK
jgi:hypothetical protein